MARSLILTTCTLALAASVSAPSAPLRFGGAHTKAPTTATVIEWMRFRHYNRPGVNEASTGDQSAPPGKALALASRFTL